MVGLINYALKRGSVFHCPVFLPVIFHGVLQTWKELPAGLFGYFLYHYRLHHEQVL